MTEALDSVHAIVLTVAFGLLSIGILFALLRLFRGPTLADRVVAVDLLGIIAVGFMSLYAIVTDDSVFLDAAIALALIAFLGTIAFARYLEMEHTPRKGSKP